MTQTAPEIFLYQNYAASALTAAGKKATEIEVPIAPVIGNSSRDDLKTLCDLFQLFEALRAVNDYEQTVIISTHQVKDVELLLDHVAIIDRNRVVVNDKMDSLFSDNESIDLERLFLNNVTH